MAAYAQRFGLMVYKQLRALLLPLRIVYVLVFSGLLIGAQPIQPAARLAAQSVALPADGFGIYDGCSVISSSCTARLQTIAGGGFKVVLNYGSFEGTAQEVLNYAAAAQKYGLKLIWAMNNAAYRDPLTSKSLLSTYPALASTCGCSDNQGFITYSIDLVKNSPVTWGYYVGDEVPLSDYSAWSTFSQFVHEVDPIHPRLLVEGTKTNQYANTDLDTLQSQAETIGQDYYPIGDSNIVPYTKTGTLASGVQAIATQYHKDLALVLQNFSWQDYYPPARCSSWPSCAPWPTQTQLEAMLTATLANSHPQLVLYYSYFDMSDSANTSSFTQLYANLTNAVCDVSQSCGSGSSSGGSPGPSPVPASQSGGSQSSGSKPASSVSNSPASTTGQHNATVPMLAAMNLVAAFASPQNVLLVALLIGIVLTYVIVKWRTSPYRAKIAGAKPVDDSHADQVVVTSDDIERQKKSK